MLILGFFILFLFVLVAVVIFTERVRSSNNSFWARFIPTKWHLAYFLFWLALAMLVSYSADTLFLAQPLAKGISVNTMQVNITGSIYYISTTSEPKLYIEAFNLTDIKDAVLFRNAISIPLNSATYQALKKLNESVYNDTYTVLQGAVGPKFVVLPETALYSNGSPLSVGLLPIGGISGYCRGTNIIDCSTETIANSTYVSLSEEGNSTLVALNMTISIRNYTKILGKDVNISSNTSICSPIYCDLNLIIESKIFQPMMIQNFTLSLPYQFTNMSINFTDGYCRKTISAYYVCQSNSDFKNSGLIYSNTKSMVLNWTLPKGAAIQLKFNLNNN